MIRLVPCEVSGAIPAIPFCAANNRVLAPSDPMPTDPFGLPILRSTGISRNPPQQRIPPTEGCMVGNPARHTVQ